MAITEAKAKGYRILSFIMMQCIAFIVAIAAFIVLLNFFIKAVLAREFEQANYFGWSGGLFGAIIFIVFKYLFQITKGKSESEEK